MFYTKYRPQKFSEISQPNDVALALMQQISSKKTAHAYLFVGSRGTGKTTTARILAKALNCQNLSKKGDPCDKCDACLQIKINSFPDLIEIDAASNRGIDDIRNLKEKVNLAAVGGKKKVYIIDEVHMLTKEAFNALLKTLEEPPAHVVFILCTTELHKVPDTVKSRCQLFKFKRATKQQLVEKLETICKGEGVKDLKKIDLEKIAAAALGGFRDAETMLQQVVEGNLSVEALVGIGREEHKVAFVAALLAQDSKTCLHTIDKLVEDGISLNIWSLDLLNYLRDLLFIKACAHEGIVDTSSEVFSAMEKQATELSNASIVLMLETFMEATQLLDGASIASLPLEVAVFKLCSPANTVKEPSKPTEPLDSTDDFLAEIDFSDEFDDDTDISDAVSDDVSAVDDAIELDKVLSSWEKIVKETIVLNNSLYALLKAANPCEIRGDKLILEVSYKFHKERLEAKKNRELIGNVFRSVLGVDLNLSCIVNKKVPNNENLTDYNIAVPAINSDNLNELFDGALPL